MERNLRSHRLLVRLPFHMKARVMRDLLLSLAILTLILSTHFQYNASNLKFCTSYYNNSCNLMMDLRFQNIAHFKN